MSFVASAWNVYCEAPAFAISFIHCEHNEQFIYQLESMVDDLDLYTALQKCEILPLMRNSYYRYVIYRILLFIYMLY